MRSYGRLEPYPDARTRLGVRLRVLNHPRPAEAGLFLCLLPLEVAVDTYHDYLRAYSSELGARIVEMYPPLQGPKDPIAPALKTLLRKPLPTQAMTITGAAKYLQKEDSLRLIGECRTGKTIMSIGIAQAHANGKPYSTLVMCPPHLVLKWASSLAGTRSSWAQLERISLMAYTFVYAITLGRSYATYSEGLHEQQEPGGQATEGVSVLYLRGLHSKAGG
jgi:Predicted helicase